jgi:nuclear GTP-binding protein
VEKAISNASKKSRKQAKQNPQSRLKLKKDPGVPHLFPFKDKVLREIEQGRQSLEQEKQRKRDLLRQRQDGVSMEVEEESGIARLAQLAEERDMEFEQDDGMIIDHDFDVELSTKKDTSRKAYNKEFKKVIEQADVVLYILDARDPEGTRSKEIESMIRESPNGEKQLLLILNKIGIHPSKLALTCLDLIPPNTLNGWLIHLRRSFPVLPFHSNTNPQFTHPALPQKKLSLLLHNALKSRSAQVKHTLSVGVIGFPNTGKSSIINALTRRLGQGDKVTTGSEAGLTKESRQIKLDNAITLLDSPGIVFPGSDDETTLVLLNVLPLSSVLDVRPAIEEILKRLARGGLLKELSNVYGIPEITVSEYFDYTTELLVQVARKRGRLGRGGVPMLESAGRIVLNDWAMGKIKWWFEPPVNTTSMTDEKVVVSEWAEAFDIDALLKETDVEMKE